MTTVDFFPTNLRSSSEIKKAAVLTSSAGMGVLKKGGRLRGSQTELEEVQKMKDFYHKDFPLHFEKKKKRKLGNKSMRVSPRRPAFDQHPVRYNDDAYER